MASYGRTQYAKKTANPGVTHGGNFTKNTVGTRGPTAAPSRAAGTAEQPSPWDSKQIARAPKGTAPPPTTGGSGTGKAKEGTPYGSGRYSKKMGY